MEQKQEQRYNCAYDEILEIHKITPNPKNPNKHTKEQIQRLAKIIDYQGQRSPVVISTRSGFITKGHGRLEAMRFLGWTRVAVDFQDYTDEAQEYADIVADNAIAEWSTLDLSDINKEMLDLGPDFDVDLLGIKDFVIEPIEKFEPQSDEDDVPEVVQPITRRGDIWLLGNHRLMCGDSTMIDDVEKLMNGEKVDMVFTDPPYGVDYCSQKPTMYYGKKNGKTRERIIGDKSTDIYNNILPIFDIFLTGPAYVFCGAGKEIDLLNAIKNNGYDLINTLVWDKMRFGGQSINANYKPCFELFYYLIKKGEKRQWAGSNNEETIWRLKRDNKTDLHPTQKPVELAEKALKNHLSIKVLDLYSGSGSTLIACEKNSKKFYGMELDEKYCDVIINRWQNYTGKKATLESNGQTYEELKAERNG